MIETSKSFGPSIKGVWIPAPRYVLRRSRVLRALNQKKPGLLLETGPGPCALLRELSQKDFECTGYDTSALALEVAREMIEGVNGITVTSQPQCDWQDKFDYLLSMEVLEHIDDDLAALKEWVSWLKPGGTAVIAVPAHQRRFGPLDEWAGHLRRYDADAFVGLIEQAELRIVKFECYGFPLTNITSAIRNRLFKRNMQDGKSGDPDARKTAESGVDRGRESKLYKYQTSLPGRVVMKLADTIQNLFLNTNFGDGFVVVAEKHVGTS